MIASLVCLAGFSFAATPPASVQDTVASRPHAEVAPAAGLWHAELDGPGGPVIFGLELAIQPNGQLLGWVRNGEEKLPVGNIQLRGETLRFELWPYESAIEAKLSADGKQLAGTWTRNRGKAEPTSMPFKAQFPVPDKPMDGNLAVVLKPRYRVQFSSSEDHAVMLLNQEGNDVTGTILTTVGDYRFLAGTVRGGELVLGVFDGAHAFRFSATLQGDLSLKGDFWSRDTWHETFTAVPDDTVELPDPYGLSEWTGAVGLGDLSFPGLDGESRRLDDPAFAGKARLVVLFGTWCPNCYDETRYLNELVERYGKRGLSVLGLAFEFEDEFQDQAAGVQRYIDRMEVKYPILIAGPTDKAKASAAFPALDRVRAYPTTLFINAKGEIESVHTGFNGPATGERHIRLREEFENTIERLLSDKKGAFMNDLHPGQVFTYTSRKHEQDSRIIICSLEKHPDFPPLVHISVEGVALGDPKTPTTVIHHMPFDEMALRESLIDLETTRQVLPDFKEGYETWKEAADRGEAGVFNIAVADAVAFIEESMQGR